MRLDHDFALVSVETTQEAILVRFTESAVVLDGEATPRMMELLSFLVERLSQEHLIVDFEKVRYISSAGLGALVSLHKQARAAGKRLTVSGVSQDVYEPFAVTRLTNLLDIRPLEVQEVPPAGG
jgi:anti-sigma B factor antagonist